MHNELIVPRWPAPDNVVAGTTPRGYNGSGLPAELRFLNQVHGSAVVVARDVRDSSLPLDADAVIGNAAGDCCAIKTADCLPLLICAEDGCEVAAAHCGWRGVLAGIVENTVASLQSDSNRLLAWLGPAISQPAFEVGGEVRQAFVDSDGAAQECFIANARGRWQADLYGLARQRLARAGVEQVFGGNDCTYNDAGRFWSYRRDPECGRMVSFILIRREPAGTD